MKILPLIIVFIICSSIMLFGQNKKIDSLLTLLKTDKPDTSKINHLNDLGWELMYQNPDTSIILSMQALKIAKSLPFFGGWKGSFISSTLSNLAVYYSLKGDYHIALDYFFKALNIDNELGNKKGIERHLCNIGNVYDDQGDYPKALDYHFKALKMAEELGDKNGVANTLSNIGIVYSDEGDYPKALDYDFKSLKIKEELKDKNGIANTLDNIGIVYWNQSNYPKALDYYFKALKMSEELGNKNSIATNLGNIGAVYIEQKDYPKALDYYFKALKMDEELGNKNGIATNLGNIGSLYTFTKKYAEAEKYLSDALKLDKEIGAIDGEKQDEEFITTLYEKIGKEKLALQHYKSAMVLKDTLFNVNKNKEITRKEMTYQFEKKEAAAKAEQDKKDAVIAAEKNKQKVILYSVVGGLLLVVVFLIFVYQSLRVTRKQKRLIENQRDEIEAQRDEIEAQRDLVTEQKDHIEEIHKEVTDSINYAKRIQEAVLPVSIEARSVLGEHFILFKPKDIVSGDFYWTTKIENLLIVVVADCTGHGVPGAFMSMLGISFLTEIVNKQEVTQASHIINQLRIEIINALQQKGTSGEQKDGMDMSLVVINTSDNQLQYSGANNPLFIVTASKELKLIEADKMPVAIHEHMENFTNHEYQLQNGDCIYLASDGYEDQFGGLKNKKFMARQLKDLFVTISDKPMNEQQEILDKTFENWRGEHEQIDDVTVMGLRI